MRDIWVDIPGFPGYQINTKGDVRSYKNYQGFLSSEPHILKPRLNPNGYYIVVLYDDAHTPHQLSVHRLVGSIFMPVDDDSLVIDHLDGNKTNNDISNLEWVSCRENSVRACKAGLYEPAFRKTRQPIVATNIQTGEQQHFISVNEAARQLGYSPAIISRALNKLCTKVGDYIIDPASD